MTVINQDVRIRLVGALRQYGSEAILKELEEIYWEDYLRFKDAGKYLYLLDISNDIAKAHQRMKNANKLKAENEEVREYNK